MTYDQIAGLIAFALLYVVSVGYAWESGHRRGFKEGADCNDGWKDEALWWRQQFSEIDDPEAPFGKEEHF